MGKPTWNLEHALQAIMATRGCTRAQAVDLLAGEVDSGEIRLDEALGARMQLAPDVAAKLFEKRSLQAFFPLGWFADTFGFRISDLLIELKTGRLLAFPCSAAVELIMHTGGGVPQNDFGVTFKHVQDWLADPATPAHLIRQWKRAMRRPPAFTQAFLMERDRLDSSGVQMDEKTVSTLLGGVPIGHEPVLRSAVLYEGEYLQIPGEFWAHKMIEKRDIPNGKLSAAQCRRLWGLLGRSDPAPQSLPVFVCSEDLDQIRPRRRPS